MQFLLRLPLLVVVALSSCGASLAQSACSTGARTIKDCSDESAYLKPIYMPPFWPTGDAGRKPGKITLKIVVDADGNVTGSTPVSGPADLYESAVAASKTWRFEKPPSAPFSQTVELSWAFPEPCPASIADSVQVEAGGWYRSKKGNVVSMDDRFDDPLPHFPLGRQKIADAGTLKLWVSVDRDGKVKNIRVSNTLSPEIDKLALEAVRTWRFKLITDSGGGFPDQFEVPVTYTPTCQPTL